MSPTRRTALVAVVAVLGIALAAAITWGTSQLVRQRIGLASEPLTAGRRLLPPVANAPARVRHTPRPMSTTSTPTRRRFSPRSSTTPSFPPTSSTATPSTTTLSPPAATTPSSVPSAPAGPPAESTPPSSRGSRGDGGDSGSHRDD
jgi:hypothetical protein